MPVGLTDVGGNQSVRLRKIDANENVFYLGHSLNFLMIGFAMVPQCRWYGKTNARRGEARGRLTAVVLAASEFISICTRQPRRDFGTKNSRAKQMPRG